MARLLHRIALCLLIPLAGHAQSGYTDEMYRRGLEKHRSAPLFVLVAIVDSNRASERLACVDARQLLGAIHAERGIPYDEKGDAQAIEFALHQPGHRFSFRNARAQSRLRPQYSLGLVRWWREKLKDRTESQLRVELAKQNGEFHSLYRTIGKKTNSDALHAVCQVLLERGILVGQNDIVNQLYLEQ